MIAKHIHFDRRAARHPDPQNRRDYHPATAIAPGPTAMAAASACAEVFAARPCFLPTPTEVASRVARLLPAISTSTNPLQAAMRPPVVVVHSPLVENHASLRQTQEQLEDRREFVAHNPTWPEEYGAGGIQLMVLTPSSCLPGVLLSTPGETLSFDAWLQKIRGFPIRPVFGNSPNATSTVSDPTPSGGRRRGRQAAQ